MTDKLISKCTHSGDRCDITRSIADDVVQLNCHYCGLGESFLVSDSERFAAAERAHAKHACLASRELDKSPTSSGAGTDKSAPAVAPELDAAAADSESADEPEA